MNKKVKVGRLLFVIGLAVVIVGVVIFLFMQMTKKDAYAAYRDVDDTSKTFGEVESFIQDDEEKQMQFFHYPITDIATLDSEITQVIDTYKNKNSDAGIWHTDYEATLVHEQYAVVRLQAKFMQNDKEIINETHYWNYDTQRQKMLEVGDVLRGNYYDGLAQLASNAGISTIEFTTLQDFMIKADSVDFFVDGKVMNVAYEANKTYIALRNASIASIGPKDIVVPQAKPEIDPNKPMVALTFDDGPGQGTQRVLDALAKVNGRATFFLLGQRVDEYPNLVKAQYAAGHEIANHSYTHSSIQSKDASFIKEEVYSAQDAIFKACGAEGVLVRPPYGAYDQFTVDTLPYQIAMWSVDTRDWESRDPAAIQAIVNANVRDGSVILFHDIYNTSADAAEVLIPSLTQQGYQLVTMSDLLKYRSE